MDFLFLLHLILNSNDFCSLNFTFLEVFSKGCFVRAVKISNLFVSYLFVRFLKFISFGINLLLLGFVILFSFFCLFSLHIHTLLMCFFSSSFDKKFFVACVLGQEHPCAVKGFHDTVPRGLEKLDEDNLIIEDYVADAFVSVLGEGACINPLVLLIPPLSVDIFELIGKILRRFRHMLEPHY